MTHASGSRRRSAGTVLACAAALLAAAPQPAALAASAAGHVSVTILPLAAGVGGGAMGFGTAGGPGAPVRIALGPSGQAGGPAPYSVGGAVATGQLTVTGLPGTPVTLSLSAGDVARGPGAPILFRVVGASPGGFAAIDRSGALRLALGATLSVGPQQAPGAYRGSYAVTVDY